MPDYLLRNVPADLWRKVRSKAALEGVSVRDLLVRMLYEYVGEKLKLGSPKQK